MTTPPILLFLILTLAACKSSPSGRGSDGGADGANRDVLSLDTVAGDLSPERAPTDADTDQALDVARDADAAPPDTVSTAGCGAVGSACITEGEGCSSGDAVEIACRAFRVCRGGRWQSVQ